MILKTFTFLSMAIITLFLIWGFGWLWFATGIALSGSEENKAKTDAIIVLTGGNGRVNEGLNLLADNLSDKLFISGVNKEVTKDDIYASWKKPTANKPCCIYLGYEAIDTEGNGIETQKWVKENNIQSIRLVTSSYHMPRAYQEISKKLPEVEIITHPVFSDDFLPWKGRFWELSFSEYNKTLIRWLHLNNGQAVSP